MSEKGKKGKRWIEGKKISENCQKRRKQKGDTNKSKERLIEEKKSRENGRKNITRNKM